MYPPIAPPTDSVTVLLLMFDDMELLDFAGPYEVFTTATRVQARRAPTAPPAFRVQTASLDGQPVRARAGLTLAADQCVQQAPRPDLLIIPGGVVDALLTHRPLLDWLAALAPSVGCIASVCTGAFVLAEAGLLGEQAEATTHWEDLPDLARRYPRLRVRDDVRWTEQGQRLTSAGIAAGIDMSLHLVSRYVDPALAQATARQMDTPWRPDPRL